MVEECRKCAPSPSMQPYPTIYPWPTTGGMREVPWWTQPTIIVSVADAART